ncbi:MAG: hypothetical protein RRY23_00175 [Alistipes sp.]
MAILTTGLPEYGFLNDLPDIIFSEVTTTASVTVKFNGSTLLSSVKMTPDVKKKITIYAKQMIRNMVSLTKPDSCAVELPQLAVQISIPDWGILSTSGYVIPGNTNNLGIISQQWFSENFLTWQPQIIETTLTQPQWLALIPAPSFAQYEILSNLYTRDGRTFTQSFFNIPSGPNFQQFRADFAILWNSYCITHDLDPYCYDVFGYGCSLSTNSLDANQGIIPAKVIDARTLNKPYAQRYILRPERYNDVCFGFENTLGGFDTIMLTGKQAYQPEGDISTFKTYTTEKELINDYTSIWEANTGWLETERTANQFQDFLKSTNRYVLLQGIWRRIIVNEYKIKHSRGESNSYTFKYHLADRNEGRYYEREELPEVDLPLIFSV